MNTLQYFSKALKAEWVKQKGSGFMWLTIGAALFIPVMLTLVQLAIDFSEIKQASAKNPWKDFLDGCFTGFGNMFYPIYLTIITVRLTQFEHRNGGWKLIETQPVDKFSIFMSKVVVALSFSLLCIVSIIVFSLLGSCVIMLVKPTSQFSNYSIPFDEMLIFGFRLFISGLGILGLQYMFSVLISGFVWPFVIGLVGTIAGLILKGFNIIDWWPYATTSYTVSSPDTLPSGKLFLPQEWISIVWFVLALFLGVLWYNRKTFRRAFLYPTYRLAYLLSIPFAMVAFWFIGKPAILPPHNRTVIAGVIDSKQPVDKILLIDELYNETVLEIPVTNNKFHFLVKKPLAAATYFLKIGGDQAITVFITTNDSLYINYKTDGISNSAKIAGNRYAENAFLKSGALRSGYETFYLERNGYEMKPENYTRELLKAWRQVIKNITQYKTSDNIKPSPDFIALQKKLQSIPLLKLLEFNYVQTFKIYNPNDSLVLPASINELRNSLSYNDSSLLFNNGYRELVKEYYQQKYRMSAYNDSIYLATSIQQIPEGAIRNFLLFDKLKQTLSNTRDSLVRNQYLETFSSAISYPVLQQKLIAQNQLLKSLQRGKPAPDFIAVSLKKDTFSLTDFKNRYIVVDVWATWCGPCKTESPNFERIAEQYSSNKVAFVALSIDEDKWTWRYQAQEKSKKVLQLLSSDKWTLGASYGFESIPRFLLIGPDSKIINIQMPNPSNPEFEEIIKRETQGL
jgi:thiol-disulfide isomerase/thioredoxin